jgi:hypothetical protein
MEVVQMSDQAHEEIKFADELVASVLDGTKEATVRYDGFEDVDVGDTLVATTADGSPFAELEVRRTASVLAVEVHELLAVFGAGYSSTCPQDVIDCLNKYYDAAIGPDTTVQVLVFDIQTRLSTN